ncbi:DUF4392 domain-containing protein [Paenibacillus solisilvae]|uniref:DUF4392 domain-containing protein n=1 Tax=Paenibacillus solisilvae TaxID=2486751 RepID=A0ABW0W1S1_9BACL
MESVFEQIENLIWDDAGGRGLTTFALGGQLKGASISLLKARHVLIVSGFYIEKSGSGETDGPLGTVFLARALEKLGAVVTLLTSPFNCAILARASQEAGLSGKVTAIGKGEESNIFPKLLADADLTHLIAVEQMGAAVDGNYYSMLGSDLTHSTARFDSLFLLARDRGIVTIGIGDGGNELGMGKLYSTLCGDDVYNRICCITPADYLIVAGISNWGAYGLVAALSCIARIQLLHEAEQEKTMLEAIIQAGAVDGRTLTASMSVDGLPISKQMQVVNELRHLYDLAEAERSENNERFAAFAARRGENADS